jgi:hypothetical protein
MQYNLLELTPENVEEILNESGYFSCVIDYAKLEGIKFFQDGRIQYAYVCDFYEDDCDITGEVYITKDGQYISAEF